MLNYVRQGQGEPLVLVHGIGSQWQMWGPVLERLGAERDVVAIDLPGFGASPMLDREPTVAALADAVAAFVTQLGIERPHVACNSLGGGIGATRNLAASHGFDDPLSHVVAYDWVHGDLDVPVTVAWGSRDHLLIPRQGRRARRRLRHARHVVLRGCGDVPTWDDPVLPGVLLGGSAA